MKILITIAEKVLDAICFVTQDDRKLAILTRTIIVILAGFILFYCLPSLSILLFVKLGLVNPSTSLISMGFVKATTFVLFEYFIGALVFFITFAVIKYITIPIVSWIILGEE